MKKNFFWANFVTSLLLSPALLTGCQPMEDLFGGPPKTAYDRHQTSAYHRGGAESSKSYSRGASTAVSSASEAATPPMHKTNYLTSSAAVPVEPPSVKSTAPSEVPSVDTGSSSSSASASSAKSTANSSGAVSVPSTATVVPATAPTMTAPVAQ